MVHDFAIDPKTSQPYAACSNLTSTSPVTWGSFIGIVDLTPAKPPATGIAIAPVTAQDIFGTVVKGKCGETGKSKGATKKCYDQINTGFVGPDGIFFVTAFDHADGPPYPETVLGVDVSGDGEVVWEQPPMDAGGGNLIDMVWVPKVSGSK